MHRRTLGVLTAMALSLSLSAPGATAALAETGKADVRPAAKRPAEAATRMPAPTPMPPGRPGGTLYVMLREDLSQGFAIHETATIPVVFPASPCFNNLVMFDPANPVEGPDSVAPEPAEQWSWQDTYDHNIFNFGRMQNVWREK